MASNKYPKVFGTFGVEFDTSEIENIVKDSPYYNINLLPDCRVFIFGAEVTKDVLSVTVNNSLNSIGTCSIQLANPRGKYTLSRNDLRKKWREDKDILSSYTYKQFEHLSQAGVADTLKNFSKYVAGQPAEDVFNAGKKVVKGLQDLFGGSLSAPTSRMIFETKFYSGMNKNVGDIVFDYRDPVQVFFKGRFSPYWYFGFTGVITGFDENYEYGSAETINLSCENVLHLWSKQPLVTRSSMLLAGRYELASQNQKNQVSGTEQSLSIQNMRSLSFNKFVQYCGFGFADLFQVHNSNLILNNIPASSLDTESEKMIKELSGKREDQRYIENNNRIDYFLWSQSGSGTKEDFLATKERLRKIFHTCKMSGNTKSFVESLFRMDPKFGGNEYDGALNTHLDFMFSGKRFTGGESMPDPLGLNSSDGSGYTTKGPNSQKLSSWQNLYLQFFKIAPKTLKTQNEIPKWYESSLRFWEYNPIIADGDSAQLANNETGWVDQESFCVAGTNPALKYDFVSNFNMLVNIWTQVETKKDYIDKLVVTPADKIRGMVAGSPTEYTSSKTAGKHANFFRPRLFALLPRRYNSEKAADAGAFTELDLFKTETLGTFEAMVEMCKKLDYYVYGNAMGDICIEPELFDTHPKMFMEPRQYLNFYSELEPPAAFGLSTQTLGYADTTSSKEVAVNDSKDPEVTYRSPSSYDTSKKITDSKSVSWFGERSVHPLTIMGKDIFRITQTFQASQMATSVSVTGAMFPMGEVHQDVLGSMAAVEQSLDNAKQKEDMAILDRNYGKNTNENMFASKPYVADGFDTNLFKLYNPASNNDLEVNAQRLLLLEKSVISFLTNTYFNKPLAVVLYELSEYYFNLYYFTNKEEHKNQSFVYTNILKTTGSNSLIDEDEVTSLNARKVTSSLYDLKKSYINSDYVYNGRPVYATAYNQDSDLSYEFDLRTAIAQVESTEQSLATINANMSFIDSFEDPLYLKFVDDKMYYQKQLEIDTKNKDIAQKNFDAAETAAWTTAIPRLINDKKNEYMNSVSNIMLSIIAPELYSITDLVQPRDANYIKLSDENKRIKVKIGYQNHKIEDLSTMKDLFGDVSDPLTASFANSYLASNGGDFAFPETTVSPILKKCFMPLFRDFVLCKDDSKNTDTILAPRTAYFDYRNSKSFVQGKDKKANAVKTLGQLKFLEGEGLYNPKRDLVRLYGYNPAPPKKFMYVTNKAAAYHYAMMYLNQYLGKAFTISCSMVGRPEMQLNRPHYIKPKDAIGLSSQYSISYSYGSQFTTNAVFTHIRKNSISYEYSMGKLDLLPTSVKGIDQNLEFSKMATNYYKAINTANSVTKAIGSVNSSVGNLVSQPSINRVINGAIVNKANSSKPGLYSFHDEIGQIDLDKRMSEEDEDYSKLSGSALPTGMNPFDSAEVRKICINIDDTKKEFNTKSLQYRTNNKRILELRNESDNLTNKLQELNASISGGIVNSTSIFVYRKDGLDITEDTKLPFYTGVDTSASCTLTINSGSGVEKSEFVIDTNATATDNVVANLYFQILGSAYGTTGIRFVIPLELKKTLNNNVQYMSWETLATTVKGYIDAHVNGSSVVTINSTILESGSKILGIKFEIDGVKSGYPLDESISLDGKKIPSKTDKSTDVYNLINSVYSGIPTTSAFYSLSGNTLIAMDNISVAKTSKYAFYLARIQENSGYQLPDGRTLAVQDSSWDYLYKAGSESFFGLKTWGDFKTKMDSIGGDLFECKIANGIVELVPKVPVENDKKFYMIQNVFNGYSKDFKYQNLFSVIAQSTLENTSYGIETKYGSYIDSRVNSINESIDLNLMQLDTLSSANDVLRSDGVKLQKQLIGPAFSDDKVNTIMLQESYDGKEHDTLLKTWTITYFENTKDAMIYDLRTSYFYQLLMETYKTTNVKEWELKYTPQMVTGSFNTSPIYSYIESKPDKAQTQTNYREAYVWGASSENDANGNQTANSSKDDKILFLIGRPSSPTERGNNNSNVTDDLAELDKIIYKFTSNLNKTEEDYTAYDAELRLFLVGDGANVKGHIFPYTTSSNSGLTKIEDLLRDYREKFDAEKLSVSVLGFTCVVDDDKYNQGLSERRAVCIKKILEAGLLVPTKKGDPGKIYMQIPSDRFYKVQGFGENKDLLASEDIADIDEIRNAKNKAEFQQKGANKINRRVEIYIQKLDEVKVPYTVWEDWNDPVTLRKKDDITKNYPLENGKF